MTLVQSSSCIYLTTNIYVVYFGAYVYRYMYTKVQVHINTVVHVLEIHGRSKLVYDIYAIHI